MKHQVTYDGERWSNATEDRIEIVEYNPEWADLFRTECRILRSVLPSDIGCTIEHFGSTAIPGIAAKPIIDIFLICNDRDQWERFITPLTSIGYVFWKDNLRTDRMFFVKGMPPYGDGRTHHVHVRKPEDTKAELLFRDYLRQHPEEAHRYTKLKHQLMSQYKTNRDAYGKGKKEYIKNINEKAGMWKKNTGRGKRIF